MVDITRHNSRDRDRPKQSHSGSIGGATRDTEALEALSGIVSFFSFRSKMSKHHIPFDFEIPMSVFEKADAEPGKERRIGGIASLEIEDKQQETLLQRGLDFSDFQKNGWFNDNHNKQTAGAVGYPDTVKHFRKGEALPDKSTAPADGHWVEGHLLKGHKPADDIWDLANALAKADTPRRLGFSVEGSVLKRFVKGGKKFIAAAVVRDVAITRCPVLAGSRMEVLAKSLQVMEDADPDVLERALTMGEATPGVTPVGPRTGEGAGEILSPESLETDDEDEKKKKKKKGLKKLTKAEAIAFVRARLPHATLAQAERFIELTKALKRQNKLCI